MHVKKAIAISLLSCYFQACNVVPVLGQALTSRTMISRLHDLPYSSTMIHHHQLVYFLYQLLGQQYCTYVNSTLTTVQGKYSGERILGGRQVSSL